MIPICHCGEPNVTPREPTPDEAKWMKALERVLLAAPPGVGVYTTGDHSLMVFDKARATEHGIEHYHDGGAWAHGIVLGTIRSAVGIEGVSG